MSKLALLPQHLVVSLGGARLRARFGIDTIESDGGHEVLSLAGKGALVPTTMRRFYSPFWCFRCGGERPHILVRSRAGGFVSWDCEACGSPRYARLADLPLADCDRCGERLVPGRSPMGNYTFNCARCEVAVLLADLIPRWEDLFDYHGLPIDPDYRSTDDRSG